MLAKDSTAPSPAGPPPGEAGLQLLARVVAANGRVDAREVAELDRLSAFARLGIARDRFVALASRLARRASPALLRAPRTALPIEAVRRRLGRWLSQVEDPAQRLLLCRLACAVVRADGRVSGDERLVVDALLQGWRISPMLVAHANLRSPLG